jgi:tight adherence protein B
MHQQLELGLSLGQVLQNAARRVGLVDFNVFASVLSLSRAIGGNLPVILDRLATATRDHNQFEGQYRAATVLGRYSALFITGLAAVILFYLFFFQPDWAARFFASTTGIVLFVIAIALEVGGLVLLWWLMRVEY